MTKININGLEINACHGVLESEKHTPQPFVFDIELDVDFTAAAINDDLSGTVNYAEVCALVRKTALSHCYDLIESLSRECALAILEGFPLASAVKVTVGKPEAPIEEKFASVSATFTAERQNVILSLGSSMGDRRAILGEAVSALGGVRGIKIRRTSDFIVTPPYGGVAKNQFLNCAVLIECLLSPRQLLHEIHRIEDGLGRVRTERWADRTADIDIIFFGDRIIAEEGLIVPHPDYYNRDFVLIPIKQIAPEFVCPIKRVPLKQL